MEMEQQASDIFTRVEHPGRCRDLLETLCAQGDAQLLCIYQEEQPLPVLLMEVSPDEELVLDLTSAPGVADMLEKMPESFVLTGRAGGTLLQTAPLRPRQRLEVAGRVQIACDWPQWLEVLHRRSTFRAELNARMEVLVTVKAENSDRLFGGRLLDLSLGGCRLELQAAGGAAELQAEHVLERIELQFPNGQKVNLNGVVRHAQISGDWQSVRFGCGFGELSAELERRLWFYVREIEREGARTAVGGDASLAPSALFVRPEQSKAVDSVPRPHGLDYATPMARRLARVAVYLNGQLLQLQQGGEVDPVLLSRHSEFLLNLLDEDRESMLFASHCLVDDSPLVQHSIAVATRLADLIAARNAPRDLVKAVVACALVHDLGKALLPPALLRVERMSAEQRSEFATHVGMLRARMDSCKWIPEPVIRGIVEGINERLDGSGYPLALKGEQLGELARVAAVVDVVDAMSRARPDRPGQAVSGIYRYLIGREAQLDSQWCSRYIRHFGIIPIGALVRFAEGALGWVQRLDTQGRIAQVQLTDQATLLGATLSEPLTGTELGKLGKVEGIIVPEARWA